MGLWQILDTAGNAVDFDDLQFLVEISDGAGMPPVRNVATLFGLADGAIFQRTVVQPRVMVFTATLKDGVSLASLHAKRKELINLIKPDRLPTQEPFTLRYTGAGTTVEIECYYDAGLELHALFGYNERIALRLVAYDPYWRELNDVTLELVPSAQIAANYILKRSANGSWQALGTGAGGTIRAITKSPSGTILAAGDWQFTDAAGTFYQVGEWDGAAWSRVANGVSPGDGGFDGPVYALAFVGDVLVAGGAFTQVRDDGAAATAGRIAARDTSPGERWHVLGNNQDNGFADGEVRALAFDGTDLYIGGTFTQSGQTLAGRRRLARWRSSVVSELGGGLNGAVYALAMSEEGRRVAIGGTFTTRADGTDLSDRYEEWSTVASGFVGILGSQFGALDGAVYAIADHQDGAGITLDTYVAGEFTTAGGAAAGRLARQSLGARGLDWDVIDTGLDDPDDVIYALAIDDNNRLWVGGRFDAIGGVQTKGLAYYDLTFGTWHHPGVTLPGASPTVYAIYYADGDIYVGFDTAGTVSYGGPVTFTNPGTAAAYPVIEFAGSGGINSLTNETTGQAIEFSGLAVAPGETVTLDLRPGRKSLTSDARGNLTGKIDPTSDLVGWKLLNGENTVTLDADESVTATLTFRPHHWSIDGGAA